MSALVCVGRYETREEAEIARIALGAAGIEATVSADDVGGTMGPLSNGVELLVIEENVAAATEIIPAEDRPSAGDGGAAE